MVKVVRSVAICVVIAAVSLELTQAASLECNAYMPTGVDAPLTDDHPAVMKEYNEAVPVVDLCKTGANGSSTGYPRNLRRMEDATNSDIDDLQSYFGESLEMDFTALKEQYSSGAAPTTPWPGSYWPTYQDSINVIWKSGEKSASEKYANAFGLDPTDFKNKVSANNGIDSRSSSTKCTDDSACKSRNDGSVCGIRKGGSNGYCIPTWYGICHAWSPAALLEAEPKCDVVKNGQTFHVMDIKALITDVYDGSAITTIFTGARFNGPDIPVSTDAYGRFTSAARRDLGAGFFHIAISNILGKHKQSFVVDVTAGSQVWNQPVRSYSVQTMELVDVDQASQQYFGISPYPFNTEMVYLAYVKTTLSWIVEAYADGPLVSTQKVDSYTVSNDYEYLLELDAKYTVIGGEWVESSKTDHPDFLWFPTAKPDASTVTSTGLSYANVRELLELSVSCAATEATSTSTSASASASTSASEAASASASASTTSSTSASASTTGSASTSTTDSTSASAWTSTSTSASGASANGASTNTSEAASAGSSTSSGSNGSGHEASSIDNSRARTDETASAGVIASSSKSDEGSNETTRSASDDGSAAVTTGGEGTGGKHTSSSGSTGTTDATGTYSSRSSTGSTEEDTVANLPSGKDALILIPSTIVPSTTSIEESTDAPIDTGYYTAPPTMDGQDLADVIENIDATTSSSPPVLAPNKRETVTAMTTTTQTSVHNSCR